MRIVIVPFILKHHIYWWCHN